MPKVKQVDFDLNTINNELTGESSDLPREMMGNLIEGQPYQFKITTLYPTTKEYKKNDYYNFRIDVVGKGLKYVWGQILNKEFRSFALQSYSNSYYRQLSAVFDGMKVVCQVTDKYGTVKYSNEIRMKMI